MEDFSKLRPVQIHCNNCGTLLTGYQDNRGLTKYTCPRCGVICVSSLKKPRGELTVKTYPPGYKI